MTIEGVSGLYLNAYPLTFSGQMVLWRLQAPADADKLEVRAAAGCSVWQDDERTWWTAHEPEGGQPKQREVPALPVTSLSLFVLREALVDLAEASGHQAWITRGEVDVLGLLPAQEEDAFIVEPLLNLRVLREQYIDAHAVLQFRQRMRWRVAGHLGDRAQHSYAQGARAVRLRGEGPRRGRIARVSTDELVLIVGEEEVSVAPDAYAMVASQALVAAWRGPEVLRQLQIASGTYTVRRRRNLHAVKERFRSGADMIRKLGLTVPMPGDAQVQIARRPVEVQLEDR